MKRINNATVQALLLLCILSCYGWLLAHDLRLLDQHHRHQNNDASRTLSLLVDQPSGYDVSGRYVSPKGYSSKRTVVFLLHSASLTNELAFWDHVATLLSTHPDIGLVAYCDSRDCAMSVHKMTHIAFPVLVSGDTGAVEAVVNADAGGKALVKTVGSSQQSTIVWRSATSTPEKVAREVVQ